MRKKSHIALAKDIVRSTDDEELKKHRWAFYIGSILPDIKPSFVYRKHEITSTFGKVKKDIEALSREQKEKKGQKRKYYRNLGQVTHYIADYFTFPHNRIYSGGLKEHCSYEERLKQRLREYLKIRKENRERIKKQNFVNSEAICDFIEKSHEEYLKRKIDVDEDIKHIVSLNHQVVEGIKQLAQKGRMKHRQLLWKNVNEHEY